MAALQVCAKAAALAAQEVPIVTPVIFSLETGETITAAPAPAPGLHRPSSSELWWPYVSGSGGGSLAARRLAGRPAPAGANGKESFGISKANGGKQRHEMKSRPDSRR